MAKNTLLIRTDANTHIGTGHVMRCIALAQAWLETGGEVIFVISRLSQSLEGKISQDGFCVFYQDEIPGSVLDADYTISIAQKNKAKWIVVDGYQFNDNYQNRIKAANKKLLVIDDFGHSKKYFADIVLNQNEYASMVFYKDYTLDTRFLLGGKYTLLRREFLQKKSVSGKKQFDSVKLILVTMGGSDPDNITSMVLDNLLQIIFESSISVIAVVGRMNRFFNSGNSHYGDNEKVRIIRATDEMPDLIRRADIAITGAGTTTWEIAFLGTPMIAIVLSDNQKRVAAMLEQAGAAISIGDRTDIPERFGPAIRELIQSPQRRKALATNAQQLIDGGGASRVVMQMQNRKIRLRDVSEDDSKLLFMWANDPVVRQNAFEQNSIDRVTHERWFVKKLHSPDCSIFIAVDEDDTPVGQIRFDRSNESADVDISIVSSQRNKSLGLEILGLGVAKLLHNTDINKIHAYVKPGNIASKKMFEQAGFFCSGKTHIKGMEVFHFVYYRFNKPGLE